MCNFSKWQSGRSLARCWFNNCAHTHSRIFISYRQLQLSSSLTTEIQILSLRKTDKELKCKVRWMKMENSWYVIIFAYLFFIIEMLRQFASFLNEFKPLQGKFNCKFNFVFSLTHMSFLSSKILINEFSVCWVKQEMVRVCRQSNRQTPNLVEPDNVKPNDRFKIIRASNQINSTISQDQSVSAIHQSLGLSRLSSQILFETFSRSTW